MSFSPATSKTHAALVRAMVGISGQTLTAIDIRALVGEYVTEISKNIRWLFPTGHCDNHTAKGAYLLGYFWNECPEFMHHSIKHWINNQGLAILWPKDKPHHFEMERKSGTEFVVMRAANG